MQNLGFRPLATPYRQTHNTYLPETANHIGGKVRMQERLDGAGSPVARTYFAYDGTAAGIGTRGLLTLVQAANGFTPSETIADTAYGYDAYGNRIETRAYLDYGTPGALPGGASRLTSTTYDATLHAYPVGVTDALGRVTTTGYDFGLGRPTDVTDPNGRTTTTQYDGLGRVTAITYPGYAQPNARYVYPVPVGGAVAAPFNVRMEAWDELGPGGARYRAAWTIYDGLGRAVQAQGPDEAGTGLVVSDTSYDARGRAEKSGRPRAVAGSGGTYFAPTWASVPHTVTAYDALARATSVQYPGGSAETASYSGLRTTRWDRNGHQTVQESDAFGRLVKVEEYTGTGPYTLYAATAYAYDRRDLLTGVTDAAGNATSISYDALGRKTAMTDPDMGAWGYAYDPLGNLTTQSDARGCATTLAYDDLNRLTGKAYAGPGACGTTPAVGFTYDAGPNGIGRRTGMSDASGTTSWGYDALGRVASETRTLDGTAYAIGRTFDAFGRLRTETYPDGEVVTSAYNAMGALDSLTSSLGTAYASNLDYNAAGQVTGLALGNGVTTAYAYNATTGRLESAVSAKIPQTPVLDLSYALYDPVGNITRIVDATRGETITYAYDERRRLTGASGAVTQSFAYSAIGNLTAKSGVAQVYAAPGHAHAVSSLSTGETFGYDANGNMTSRTEGGVTYAQSFDAENRLVAVTANGQTTQFVYNGDGQLAKKVAPDGTVTLYVGHLYEVQTGGGGGPTPTATPTLTPTATPTGGTRLKDITFEDGSLTHPASGADSTNGTVQLETAAPLKGAYSARIPGVGSAYLLENFAAADDVSVSFYIKLNSLPGANVRVASLASSGTITGNLLLLSSGRVRLRNGTTVIGADSAPLAVGTLYRLGLRQKKGSGTSGVLEAYLATGDAPFGAPFASTTVGTWTAGADRLRAGADDNDALDAVFDDIRLDTAAMPGPSGGAPTPAPTSTPSPTPAGGGSRLKDITFEGGSLTHPASGADSTSGAVTLESAAPLKGAYAARGAGVANAILIEDFAAAGDLYVSFYFKAGALPSANVRIARLTSGAANGGNLLLLPSGALRLRFDTTTVGADSAALSAGTPYRIGLRQKQGSGSNGVLEAYLAVGDAPFGTPFASTATGAWTSAPDRLRAGADDNDALDATFDDVRLDTAAMPGPSGGGGPTPTPTASPTPPPSGTHTTSYYALPGATVVRVDGVVSYVLSDHLGSASVVLDANGNVTAQQRYLPFGESRLTATLPTDRLFTGQRRLAGLGLDHFSARAYSPALGRFVSADPIVPEPGKPQALNRYSYVYNNPTGLVDPSGHSPCDDPYWPTAFRGAQGRDPTAQDYADCVYADTHPGSGPGGQWTDADWESLARLHTLQDLAISLDLLAAGLNTLYAAVADVTLLAYPPAGTALFAAYPGLSAIPNSISTLSGLAWVYIDVATGTTYIQVNASREALMVSGRVGQDTVVAIATNALGWTVLKEPNTAAMVDWAVGLYDLYRTPNNLWTIPTIISPSFSWTLWYPQSPVPSYQRRE